MGYGRRTSYTGQDSSPWSWDTEHVDMRGGPLSPRSWLNGWIQLAFALEPSFRLRRSNLVSPLGHPSAPTPSEA